MVPIEASSDADVPQVPYAPERLPLFKRQYANTIFTGEPWLPLRRRAKRLGVSSDARARVAALPTGSKAPDPACYGHTQFHLVPDRYHRDRLARRQQSDQVEVFLRANAIASLFAWTAAQASYQGPASKRTAHCRF